MTADQNLTSNGYYELDGFFYCETCYSELSRKKCHYCEEFIQDDKIIVAENKYYHEHHFQCSLCMEPLKGTNSWGTYFKANHALTCEKCFKKLDSFVCAVCNKKMEEEYVTMNEKCYHQDCMRCTICKQLLIENAAVVDDKLYHVDCYMKHQYKICGLCEDSIIHEEGVQVGGWTVHMRCAAAIEADKDLLNR